MSQAPDSFPRSLRLGDLPDDLARLIIRNARKKPATGRTRLIWLMAETASKSGYCSKRLDTLATELAEPSGSVERWRQALVAMGCLELKLNKRERGYEQRYYLIRHPGESLGDVYKRLRQDRRFDLTLRCLWLLHDITRAGCCEVSQAEIAGHLGVKHLPQIKAALRGALGLGYFVLQRGNGRGHPSLYTRCERPAANNIIEIFPTFS